jgi:hypothetical protein
VSTLGDLGGEVIMFVIGPLLMLASVLVLIFFGRGPNE